MILFYRQAEEVQVLNDQEYADALKRSLWLRDDEQNNLAGAVNKAVAALFGRK